MRVVAKIVVLFVLVAAVTFSAEGLVSLAQPDWVDEASLILAIGASLSFVWLLPRASELGGQASAISLRALLFGLLFGANYLVPKSLIVRPGDEATAMQFSWFAPFYLNVEWIGGTIVTGLLSILFPLKPDVSQGGSS